MDEDVIHITVVVDNPELLNEVRVYLDTDKDYTANYFVKEFKNGSRF